MYASGSNITIRDSSVMYRV